MTKQALVLGGGGFIGSHLVKSLKEQGFWVRAADLKYPEHWDTYTDQFMIGDLRDPQFVAEVINLKFDEVYQLAADMGGAGYIFTGENDADIMHNSALINLNVLPQAHKMGIHGVFYSSSACMYPAYNQDNPDDFTCEESSAYPAAPDSEYGWEKLFSERLYLAFNRNYGMKNKVARYHNIFGPYGTFDGGKEKAPAALCRKVAKATDSIEIWGDGSQLRSFLYIDECVKFTQEFYREPDFFEPINIGSTHTVSITELAEMIADIAGKNLTFKYIDGPTGVRARTSHNQLIQKVLGDAPNESLYEGLIHTYKWIRSQVL
jgi:nucleoside-diphosphate-sugar epimerase